MSSTTNGNDINSTRASNDARRLGALLTSFDNARRVLDQRATLGAADMRLLWLFHDGTARTLRQIAEQLSLEQSTVNRQVNTAVQEGLLTKTRSTSSEPYRFMTSAAGDREFEHTLEVTLGVYRRALETLDDDAETFLVLFERYVEAYRQAVQHTEPES